MIGELKAIEALDLLIANLGTNNGVLSATMSHHPALTAVIKIGPMAIPNLSQVLKTNKHPDVRRYAVYCIAGIGGPMAYSALEQAIPSESDPCVNRFMRASLVTINVQDGGLKSDTVEWCAAFQCSRAGKA